MKITQPNLTRDGDAWRLRWYVNGKRHQEYLGKVSKATATAIRDAKRRELLITPDAATIDKITVGQASALYLRHAEQTKSRRTLWLEQKAVNSLRDFVGPSWQMSNVTRRQASEWVASLHELGLAENTVRRYVRHAKGMFSWAEREGYRAGRSPLSGQASSVLQVDRVGRYVTHDEMDRILDACPCDGWRSMFALCRYAGLRINEAHRMEWRDIDFEAHTLTTRAKSTRASGQTSTASTTKQRTRTIPIVPRLMAVLVRANESAPPGLPTIGPVSPRTGRPIRNLHAAGAKAIVTRSGVPPYGDTFHQLRADAEQDFYAMGAHPFDVCAWLGHSAAVAAKHYHQTRPETIDTITGRRSSGVHGSDDRSAASASST